MANLGTIQSLALQRPTGSHGPRTFMEADPAREQKIARDGELQRGKQAKESARVLSRRRISRLDETKDARRSGKGANTDEAELSRLAYIAALTVTDDEGKEK